MTDYAALARRLQAAIAAGTPEEAMTLTVRELRDALPKYTWTGIYLRDGDDLVLGPFVGRPSPHTRIPVGRGICGAAAASGATITVDDVNADPRYLACSVETRSEIVVPILHEGRVLGEIDVDSDEAAAFDARDRALLESLAAALGERLAPAREAAGGRP